MSSVNSGVEINGAGMEYERDVSGINMKINGENSF